MLGRKGAAAWEKHLRDVNDFVYMPVASQLPKIGAAYKEQGSTFSRLQSVFWLRKRLAAYAAFTDKSGKTTDKNIKMDLLR